MCSTSAATSPATVGGLAARFARIDVQILGRRHSAG